MPGLLNAFERGPEYMLSRFANLPDPAQVMLAGVRNPKRRRLDNYQRLQTSAFRAKYRLKEMCKNCGKTRGKHSISRSDPNFHSFERQESLALFLEEFGPLYPGLNIAGHIRYIWFFRAAWMIETQDDMQAASDFVSDVYNRRGTTPKSNKPKHPNYRPLVRVDFVAGKLGIEPRTLLDWMATWLVEYRKYLAICQWKKCRRYFVKSGRHARYRYCTQECSHQAKQRSHRESYHRTKDR